jgi:hypothetical protein
MKRKKKKKKKSSVRCYTYETHTTMHKTVKQRKYSFAPLSDIESMFCLLVAYTPPLPASQHP